MNRQLLLESVLLESDILELQVKVLALCMSEQGVLAGQGR